MSWQVRDTPTELVKLSRDANKIRDALFIQGYGNNIIGSINPGGASGSQNPIGGGAQSGMASNPPTVHILTDIDTLGVPTGIFNKIQLRTSNIIVDRVAGVLDLRFIQGTLNDGTILYIKPKNGKTMTLKTGGNIDIVADLTISDNQCAILVFYADDLSPDANGNYVVATISSGAGSSGYNLIQDEGVALVARTTLNFIGAGVVAVDNPGFARTDVTISGSGAGLATDMSNLASPTVPNKRIEMNNKEIINLLFLQSNTGLPALTGLLRTGNNQIILASRNSTNTGQFELKFDGLNIIDITRSDDQDILLQLRAQDAVFPDVSLEIMATHLGALGGEAIFNHPSVIFFKVNSNIVFKIVELGSRGGVGKFIFDPQNLGLTMDLNDKTLFQPGSIIWDDFFVASNGKVLTNAVDGNSWLYEIQTQHLDFGWGDSLPVLRTHFELGVAGIVGGSSTSVPLVPWRIKARTAIEIGFQVTSESVTNNVGTVGTMQMPRLLGFPIPFTRAQFDNLFGDVAGAFGVINIAGVPTFVVRRTDGAWYGVNLAAVV